MDGLPRNASPTYIKAETDVDMVRTLLSCGFNRLLQDDTPFQEEPLAMHDTRGREWSAMPAMINNVNRLPAKLAEAMGGYEARE